VVLAKVSDSPVERLARGVRYRIIDNNIYNFNKTSFIIGKILAQIVITSLEVASRKKVI
jgi:hypothetical protein